MNFHDRPPSEQWAALTLKGERVAEVWFKPDGEPLTLVFRVPRTSLQIAGLGERLTVENLLRAVGVPADAVESWSRQSASGSEPPVPGQDLTTPLTHFPHDADHQEFRVQLRPPPGTATPADAERPAAVPAEWRELEARWKDVLGMEATVDTLRKNVEGMRAGLDAGMKGSLSAEEKSHALAADVAQWTKAKSRVHYALPKANDFIHRATWAAGTPGRKRLGEVFKSLEAGTAPLPAAADVAQELDVHRKEQQVLSALGAAVYQECKAVAADVQASLTKLRSNAASRASMKKGGTGAKRKSL